MGGFVSRPSAPPPPPPVAAPVTEAVDSPADKAKRRKAAEGRTLGESTGVSEGEVATKSLLGA